MRVECFTAVRHLLVTHKLRIYLFWFFFFIAPLRSQHWQAELALASTTFSLIPSNILLLLKRIRKKQFDNIVVEKSVLITRICCNYSRIVGYLFNILEFYLLIIGPRVLGTYVTLF